MYPHSCLTSSMLRGCRRVLAILFVAVILPITSGCNNDSSDRSAKIDLTIDNDGDGIPDELMAEVEKLESMVSGGDTSGVDESELAEFNAEAEDFNERLPYLDTTRQLQNEINDLWNKKTSEEILNDPEAYAILENQILEKQNQMMTDNNFKLAMESLDKIQNKKYQDQSTQTVPNSTTADSNTPDWSQLRRGDILFRWKSIDFKTELYADKYSHAGVLYGANQVYESWSAGVSVGTLEDWKETKSPGANIGLARSIVSTEEDVQKSMELAYKKYGDNNKTAYSNYFWDKWRREKLYCSQLVWSIHDYLGVDLDSNDIFYTVKKTLGSLGFIYDTIHYGVMPDEIALSPFVKVYSAGKNPGKMP